MYLSNRDIRWAIHCGHLIVKPRPEEMDEGYDETSIDLHLDKVKEAQIWDIERLVKSEAGRARGQPEVHIGAFNYAVFAKQYLIGPPDEPAQGFSSEEEDQIKVFRRGPEVIIKPGGFVLWQTKEWIGTPKENPALICFVDGKSTRARTGLLVHLTAPTIHAGWSGNITLEIANVGPFHFVLRENDVIAQLTVATISSSPDPMLKKKASATLGQRHVTGKSNDKGASSSKRKKSGD